ncbi:PAS domain S-box protein, partial [Polaribacter sp.]|uniref:PAS domain-containing sensor histidine kinase n=1 Tax=Polaribacter sp. TaxID=1920175 RepID=UPI0035C855F2
SKNSFTIYYSLLFYFYLRFLDETDKDLVYFKIKDVFKPLSYKQKFEVAVDGIKKADEMYRLLTTNSNDIICLQELNGNYNYVSPSIKNILGYEQSDFLGKQIFSIVHKDDIEELQKKISEKEFLKNNQKTPLIFRLKHKLGHYIWIEYSTSPIYQDNKITSFVTSAREITDRIISKNKLDNSLLLLQKREKALNEASRIGKMGFIEYDAMKKTYIWSDYLFYIFGLEPSDRPPPQETFLNYFEKESRQRILKNIKTLQEEGKSFNIEVKGKNQINKIIWLRLIIEPVFGANKIVVGRRGVLHDITHTKQAQLKLENSLELLEKNEDSLNIAGKIGELAFIEYNTKTDTFIWSDYAYKIFGLNPRNGTPTLKDVLTFFDEKSKIKLKNLINKINTKGQPGDIELKGIKRNGEEFWVRNIAQPIFNKNKELIGRRAILQDITKYKKVQSKLENSKKELQISLRLLEKKELSLRESSRIAKIGYSDYLFETNAFYWSDYVYKIFGLDPNKEIPSREEMIAVYKGEFLEKLISATKKLDADGIPYDIELKMTNFVNKEVWIRIIGHLIYDDDKNVIGRSGVLQDITDSKLNRIELKRSKKEIENSLKQLEKNKASMDEASKVAKIGYFEYIIAKDDFRWSEYLYDIYGLDKAKPLPPRADIVAQIDKDSLPVIKQATLDLTNNGVSYDIQMKIYHKKTGKAVWVRNVAEPIFDENKNIIGRRGLAQDITDKKESIDKIARAEELYRLLADNTNDLICLQEYDSTFKYISPSIENILGYKQEEFIGRKVYDIVHPEDLKSLKNTFFNISKEVKSHAFPFRALHKKGHYIWLEFLSTPVYNGDDINYFVTSARDITQTMVANENIQEYQKSLKRLTTEITLIEEKQKKEIASNIHDHLSQSLVISKMKIKELKRNKEYEKLIKDLDFIENHITDALDNSRKITFELSPPVLYQLGIVDALFWLFEYIEKTYEIKSDIYTTLDTVKMDDTKSILLYRSIQEVVNNAVKYSKASFFTLNIDENSNYISFIFKDNGNGFDTKKLKNNHNTNGSGFGLFTVKERIENIRGKFNISSEISNGTTVVFNIPKSPSKSHNVQNIQQKLI